MKSVDSDFYLSRHAIQSRSSSFPPNRFFTDDTLPPSDQQAFLAQAIRLDRFFISDNLPATKLQWWKPEQKLGLDHFFISNKPGQPGARWRHTGRTGAHVASSWKVRHGLSAIGIRAIQPIADPWQVLVRLCQSINFGQILGIVIQNGEPVFHPEPTVRLDVKLARTHVKRRRRAFPISRFAMRCVA